MKIVIDIPKGMYENIQRRWNKVQQTEKYTLGYVLGYALEKAVVNGIPLPDKHGRLIDADALNRKNVNCANVPMNFIDTAPTIIEAERGDTE